MHAFVPAALEIARCRHASVPALSWLCRHDVDTYGILGASR
jgi:hypothetical protein